MQILLKIKPNLLDALKKLPVKRDALLTAYIERNDFVEWERLQLDSYRYVAPTNLILSTKAGLILEELVGKYEGTNRNAIMECIVRDLLQDLDIYPIKTLISRG